MNKLSIGSYSNIAVIINPRVTCTVYAASWSFSLSVLLQPLQPLEQSIPKGFSVTRTERV